MKHEWKIWLRLGVTVFVLYLAIHYWGAVSHLCLLVLGTAAPLLLGAVMAYAVNILMSIYERVYWPRSTRAAVVKSRRPVCLLLAYASLVAIVILLIRMILPELVQCVGLLVQEISPRLAQLSDLLNQNLDLSHILASSGVALTDGNIDWRGVITSAVSWLITGLGGVMGSVFSLFSAVVSTAFTLVVSLIFSIYLLVGKEKLQRQCALVLRTYLKPSWYGRLVYFLQTLNTCFHRFIVGQCTEAVILGLLCIAGMLLFRFPYATMVGTLIGFTALIPVAGAYIGAGVGAFMIFTVSPLQALLFLLFIVILQQLEGNIIYPKVVGSSIGLPGIWVLAAVTIGGGLMGILGMLVAVPLTAALYQILRMDVMRRNPPPEPPPQEPPQESAQP